MPRYWIIFTCLIALPLANCASYTAARKQVLDHPNPRYYDKMAHRIATGEGMTATYSVTLDRAITLTHFILGAHNAVALSEQDHMIFALIPDLREWTLDVNSSNALAIQLMSPAPNTVHITVLSSSGLQLTGPMLSEATFHRLFAEALQQPPHAMPQSTP